MRARVDLRRRECPVCGRVTVYRWTSSLMGPAVRVFRPHHDPSTRQPCLGGGDQ